MRKLINNRLAIGFLLVALSLFGFASINLASTDEVKLTPELIKKILDKEKRQVALPIVKEIPKTDPADPLIIEALRFARAKQYEKALEVLREAIDEYPESALAYYYSAVIYGEIGQWGNASEFSQIALTLQLEFAEAHFLYGLANSKIGRYEKAAVAYRDAVYYNPNDSEGYNNLGNTLMFLKEYETALDAYRRSLELQPSNPTTYNNLGEAYRQVGRDAEAINAYRRAIEQRPDSANTYANMSASYLALDQYEEAGDALSRAIKLGPRHPEWRYNLGLIALRLNNREVAAEQLHALQKFPKNEFVAKLNDVFTEHNELIGRVIRRKETQFTEAVTKGDSEMLGKLLADNYKFTGFKRVSNKAKELESSSLIVPGATVESITTDKITIKPSGNRISVKGQMTIQAARAGQPLCGRFAFERAYLYQDKRWQIVTEKVTPLYKQKAGCGLTSRYVKELQPGKR